MPSMMVPSCSGRVLAPALLPAQLNSFGRRHRSAALASCRLPERFEASLQHRSSERLSRRQGLTIKAAAAAEGQGFASDAGINSRELCCRVIHMSCFHQGMSLFEKFWNAQEDHHSMHASPTWLHDYRLMHDNCISLEFGF